MGIETCPFCALTEDRIVAEDSYCLTVRDGFPVSPGHTLIIPKRHISSFFETMPDERDAMFNALDKAKRNLDEEFEPAAYNIGINDGPAAGQTVGHLHVHLIPRYEGDQPDPRGGIRWVIPEKARYWSEDR